MGTKTIKNQSELFWYIWKLLTRSERKCKECGEPIINPHPINFAHILGKKAFPLFTLRAKNIVLLCPSCHVNYDGGRGVVPECIKWLRERLKQQYSWYWKNKLIVDDRIKRIYGND